MTVGLVTLSGCGWSASATDSWLTVVSGATGNANGTVTLRVAANTGSSRVGHATIGGQVFTVSQSGSSGGPEPPAPAPPPPSNPPSDEVELSGIISAFSGVCPLVFFKVDGQSIASTPVTRVEHGKCSDLSNGDEVSVEGLRLGIVVTATKIRIIKNKK